MYKNHDDFYYYHFSYTLMLTNFDKIFGLGNLIMVLEHHHQYFI